jgi:hypothetical protein
MAAAVAADYPPWKKIPLRHTAHFNVPFDPDGIIFSASTTKRFTKNF